MFGVSYSAVDNVYYYIRKQKQHPFASLCTFAKASAQAKATRKQDKKRTFENEYIKFMGLNGFYDVKLDYLLFSKSFTPLAVKSDFI